MADTYPPISVGLMGTGEYTTGITPSGQSKSDKKIGVVGVTMFDLRRRGKVGEIVMAGTNGGKVSLVLGLSRWVPIGIRSNRYLVARSNTDA